MIGVERTDYVSLPVGDLARAVAFYGETLGIERNPKAPESNPEFETGNLTISLREEPGAAPSTGYVALRVADVDAARKQLLELGIEIHGETFDTGVCHIAFFADPDGNRLSIHRRYAD